MPAHVVEKSKGVKYTQLKRMLKIIVYPSVSVYLHFFFPYSSKSKWVEKLSGDFPVKSE